MLGDDEPGRVRDVVPVVAEALGAKPPHRFPKWHKRELGWSARYPTWRTGFKAAYSAINIADRPNPRPAARPSHSAS